MASTLVLVHSPFVGPATWEPTAAELRARGRDAVVPSLVDAVVADPPRYDAMADAAAAVVGDGPVVLVGHSGAGPLLPSVAARMPGRVDGVVYVDAGLPHPGRAWSDSVPPELGEQLRSSAGADGLLPPWHEWFPDGVVRGLLPDAGLRERVLAEIPRVPVAYLDEPAPADDAPIGGYVLLSAAYDDVAAQVRGAGRPVVEHDGHHLSTVTEPAAVADAILGLVPRG